MRKNDRRVVNDENKRVRKFAEPPIPEEITGKELEKREAFALQSLAADNAERRKSCKAPCCANNVP